MAAQVAASAAPRPSVTSATDLYMSMAWEPEDDYVPEAEVAPSPQQEPAPKAEPAPGAATAAAASSPVPAAMYDATAYGYGPPSDVPFAWGQCSYASTEPLAPNCEAPALAAYANPYAPQQESEQGAWEQAWQSWYAQAPAEDAWLAQQWAAWHAAQAQPAPAAMEATEAAAREQTGLPPGAEAAPVAEAAVPDQAAATQAPAQNGGKDDGAVDARSCHAEPCQLEGTSNDGAPAGQSSAQPAAEPQREPRATLLVEGASLLLGAYGDSDHASDSSAAGAGPAASACSDGAVHSSGAGREAPAAGMRSPESAHQDGNDAADWEQDSRLAAARFLDALPAPSLGPVTPDEALQCPSAAAHSRSASQERMAPLSNASLVFHAHGDRTAAAAAEPAEADAGGTAAMQADPEAQRGDAEVQVAGVALPAAAEPDKNRACKDAWRPPAEQHAGGSRDAGQPQPEEAAREKSKGDRASELERCSPERERQAEQSRFACLAKVSVSARRALGTVAECAAQLSEGALLQLAALSPTNQVKVCGHAMRQAATGIAHRVCSATHDCACRGASSVAGSAGLCGRRAASSAQVCDCGRLADALCALQAGGRSPPARRGLGRAPRPALASTYFTRRRAPLMLKQAPSSCAGCSGTSHRQPCCSWPCGRAQALLSRLVPAERAGKLPALGKLAQLLPEEQLAVVQELSTAGALSRVGSLKDPSLWLMSRADRIRSGALAMWQPLQSRCAVPEHQQGSSSQDTAPAGMPRARHASPPPHASRPAEPGSVPAMPRAERASPVLSSSPANGLPAPVTAHGMHAYSARSSRPDEEHSAPAMLGPASLVVDAQGDRTAAAAAELEPAEAEAGGTGAMQADPEAQRGSERLQAAGAALPAAVADSETAPEGGQCPPSEPRAGRSRDARQPQHDKAARRKGEGDRASSRERRRSERDSPSQAEQRRFACLGHMVVATRRVLGTVADYTAQLSEGALLQLAALSSNSQLKVCMHAFMQAATGVAHRVCCAMHVYECRVASPGAGGAGLCGRCAASSPQGSACRHLADALRALQACGSDPAAQRGLGRAPLPALASTHRIGTTVQSLVF